jgi:hypothetical protein
MSCRSAGAGRRLSFCWHRGTLWHYSAVSARYERQTGSSDRRFTLLNKVALLTRVWAIAIQTQLALWRRPLPEVAATMGRAGTASPASIALLNRAVSRGLRVGPWQPRCLLRSLVLYRLLRAQGDEAELIIGLPHRPTSRDAHAWVELAGRDIGPAPGGSGYQELTRYPREGRRPSTPVR